MKSSLLLLLLLSFLTLNPRSLYAFHQLELPVYPGSKRHRGGTVDQEHEGSDEALGPSEKVKLVSGMLLPRRSVDFYFVGGL